MYHSQNIEGSLASIPGVRIVYPSFADDAAGLLRSAMPLSSLTIKYISPAKYDDLLVVETSICEFTPLKIVMTYNIVTKGHQVLTTGETTLISVDATSRKPKRLSASIFELINTAIRNDV